MIHEQSGKGVSCRTGNEANSNEHGIAARENGGGDHLVEQGRLEDRHRRSDDPCAEHGGDQEPGLLGYQEEKKATPAIAATPEEVMTPGTATLVTPTARPARPAATIRVRNPGEPAVRPRDRVLSAAARPGRSPVKEKTTVAARIRSAAATTADSGPCRSSVTETRTGPTVTAPRNSADSRA